MLVGGGELTGLRDYWIFNLLDFGLEVSFFFGCAEDCAGVLCVCLCGAGRANVHVMDLALAMSGAPSLGGVRGLGTHRDDIFVAFAESLESAGVVTGAQV